MSETTPLTPEQRAAIAEQIGGALPATPGLIESFADAVAQRRGHEHGREDWFCLNLAAYMGEKAGPVLRRLIDAESERDRYRIAWRFARQRALATGWAAERSGERARDLQTAVQDGFFALIALQMVRREMSDHLENLLGDYEAGEITSLQLCTKAAHMIRAWRESTPLPDRCPSNVPTGYGDDRAYWCALHVAHDVPLHQDREGHVWTEQDAEKRRPARHIRDEKDTRKGESTLPTCPVCSHPPCHCSCFSKTPDRLCPHQGEPAAEGGDSR